MIRPSLMVVVLALAGCHNACQDICFKMQRYAESECGLVVDEGDLDACLDAQAGSNSRDQRAVCRDYNTERDIADEWGCEELQDYFESQ